MSVCAKSVELKSDDNEEDSKLVKKSNTAQANFEICFIDDVNQGENSKTIIIDDDNDELVYDEDDDEEYGGDDDSEYKKLLYLRDEKNVANKAVGNSSQQQIPIKTSGRAYCNLCDRYFQNLQHYRNHMNKHTLSAPYNCTHCSKSFRSKQAQIYHIKTHTKRNEYQCPICPVSYCTENQFITHMSIHESDTCFPCMVCGKILLSNAERDEHLITHEQERPYGCYFCKRRFRQHNFLTNHLRKHCQYRCDFCPTDFHSTQIQRRPYACPQCEQFPDLRQKVESQRVLSSKNQTTESDLDTEDENEIVTLKSDSCMSTSKQAELANRIPCQYCTATFKNNYNLNYHMHKKHGAERKLNRFEVNAANETTLELNKTNYEMAELENVKRPVATQDDFEIFFVDEDDDDGTILEGDDIAEMLNEEDDDDIEYIGDDDIEYNKLLFLEDESNSGGVGGPYSVGVSGRQGKAKKNYCNICHKYISSDSRFQNHMFKHSQASPYKCEFCNKSFKSVQAIGYHLKTHSKNDQYQCSICPSIQYTENNFITHVLTHESPNCFPCMVCGKVSNSYAERDVHLKSHEKERPFACVFCKRRFRKHNFLTNHLRSHCQYRCDFCPSDFHSTQAQRRPYVCPDCEKSPTIRKQVEAKRSYPVKNQAAESDNETEDESEASGSKGAETSTSRLRCKFCYATFINKSNLAYHVRKKHGSD